MPVIKPLAVLLLLTVSSSLAILEYEPLTKVTGTPGVGLVTLTILCQGVAGQTSGESGVILRTGENYLRFVENISLI